VPLVRLRGAREEISKPVVLGVHPTTHDLNRWAYRAHIVDSSAALQVYGSRPEDELDDHQRLVRRAGISGAF
jgi:hypothetical protein